MRPRAALPPPACVLVALLAVLLAACVPQPTREFDRYHLLEAPGSPPKAAAARASTLVVMTSATSFYETRAMVFSREPGTRAYYQYNRWAEPPSQRFGALLVARLQQSGAFRSVAGARSAVSGSVLLTVELTEFYHDAAAPPGAARVAASAELIDPARRALLGRRVFEHSAPATAYDAGGAVQGFNAATAALLDEIVAWVDATAPR